MRVAFDIGGTFTDVIALGRDKRIHTAKVLSLLDRVGEDIVVCIRGLHADEPVENFVHATTMASNAVIERKTAPTGLITTRGFRDVLEMMNQKAPAIEDINWERLPPLVPRRLRFEVAERILADGTVEQRLDREGARQVIDALLAAKVEAIAICLINSYLNPEHERELGRMVREAAPRLTVCLSSQVHPECREYERTSTTVINASLVPVVNRYLDQLEKHLAPFSKRVLIMQSNGGTMTSEMARQRPMYMVESGPAAGVLAAARMAGEIGLGSVLSFDMGGTTAKACLIQNGQPLEKAGGEVGGGVAAVAVRGTGHALRAPTLDIVEVGAGGGSIAWIDDAGALRAGPISSGAEPGPACYARGGTAPTVTDANVVLGYMNPETIADGTLRIDRQLAADAIQKHIADAARPVPDGGRARNRRGGQRLDDAGAARGLHRTRPRHPRDDPGGIRRRRTNPRRRAVRERRHRPRRDTAIPGTVQRPGLAAGKQPPGLYPQRRAAVGRVERARGYAYLSRAGGAGAQGIRRTGNSFRRYGLRARG